MDNNLKEKEQVSSLSKLRKIPSGFLKDLLSFLKEYSVLGLAIGVVIGQASKELVDSIVKGLFMPFVELIISKDRFDNMVFVFRGVKFNFGAVISSSLIFLIIMTLLYFIVKKIIKNDKYLPKK